MYDVAIIGAGPAGATLAIYLKRANFNVCVIENGNTSLKNTKISNYYGYLDEDGNALYENGILQLKRLNIDLIKDEFLSFSISDNITISLKNSTIEAKKLVFAFGRNRKNLKIFDKYIGYGVSLCAHCDGPMYKNKKIYYTGVKEKLDELKEELMVYSTDLKYIDLDSISSLKGDMFLEKVILKNNDEIPLDNLFVRMNIDNLYLSSNFGLLLDMDGYIKVDENYKTNIENVYAIGDSISIISQVISASYSGMDLALKLIKDKNNG